MLLSVPVPAAAGSGAAQDASPAAKTTTTVAATMKFPITEVLKEEHAQLHAELEPRTRAGSDTGKAAQAVAEVLHVHFVKEENTPCRRSHCCCRWRTTSFRRTWPQSCR